MTVTTLRAAAPALPGAEAPIAPDVEPDLTRSIPDTSPGDRHRRTARLAIGLIQLYQLVRIGRTSPCRFVPTCSHYAVSALERHGLRRGLRLIVGRLGRCRPGGPFGSDPVPE